MPEPRNTDWTPLDLYVWTVENVGVPARTYRDERGRIQMEGPFTRLEPDALKRVLAAAGVSVSGDSE